MSICFRCLKKHIIHQMALLSVCGLFAADMDGVVEPGQLKGKLIDQSTRQPLVYANVLIEGTTKGASTDSTGQYHIGHIPPGIYNVRYMMMGYETRLSNQVVVNPGRTTWQQIEMRSRVLEGDNITVTAGYFQAARDAIVSSRSVDYQELRSDPGSAEDIQRVMQGLPSVVSGSDQSNEILVRGGMPGENLFLIDDIEIPNPNHFAEEGTSGGPINMIDPNFIRQVDFYAGAFPARYGDKASSVMDISYREGDREHVTGHFDMGMAGAGMIVEGPLNHGKGSYMMSGRKSYLDLIAGSVGLDEIPHYYSLHTKWVYDLDNQNKLTLNALYGDDFIEGEEDDDIDDDQYTWRSKSGQTVIGLGWRHMRGKHGYMKTTISQVTAKWDQWTLENGHSFYDNNSFERERTVKNEWVLLPIQGVEFQIGGQAKDIHFDISQWVQGDTLFSYQINKYGQVLSKEPYMIYDPFSQKKYDNTYKLGGFFQGKWHALPKWTITTGIRGDYFDYTQKWAVDPRLGLQFHMTPVTNINLALARQSQTPSYIQVTAHPMNQNLDYKHTHQIVLGFDHLFREDTRGSVELFYKDYQDVPIGISETTNDPFDVSDGQGVSEGRGFVKGVEFFLQKKPTGATHFTISYAYSISKAQDPRNDRYYNWDFDYRHIFTAIGGVQFHLKDKPWYQNLKENWIYKMAGWLLPLADELEISCRWRYLGGRPYTPLNYHPEFRVWSLDENIQVNTSRYPAYHRLDIRFDQRYMFNGWNIVTYLDIINVYNRENIWDYYYRSDGTVGSYLQFTFMPIGGITVEF